MTGPDLIRLAQELAAHGGIHRLTNCLAAAVHVFAEHEERRRPATVEAWEDGPVGAGMSDKAVAAPTAAYSRAPAAAEPSGRTTEAQDGRGALAGDSTHPAANFTARVTKCACGVMYEPPFQTHECDASRFRHAMANPHPITPPRGEHKPLPMAERVAAALKRVDERPAPPLDLDVIGSGPHLRPGNALTDEARGGIFHGEGSPIAEKHSGPSDRLVPRFKPFNPEDLGDGA